MVFAVIGFSVIMGLLALVRAIREQRESRDGASSPGSTAGGQANEADGGPSRVRIALYAFACLLIFGLAVFFGIMKYRALS